MTDLDKAKELLLKGYTCVLVKGEDILTSQKAGIAPMIDILNEGIDMQNFSVADKIVGRAAAFLFVKAKISAVYGEVLSKGGKSVLEDHGIPCEYGELVDNIINRKKTGICPMEETVQNDENCEEAVLLLNQKLKSLREQKYK